MTNAHVSRPRQREQHGVRDSWHAEHGWIDGYTYAILAEDWTLSVG